MNCCVPLNYVPIKIDDDDSKVLEVFFSRLIVRPIAHLRKQLDDIRYIGPIREVPERNHKAPFIEENSRWSNGLAAWDILYRASPSDSVDSDGLVSLINGYISDVLNLGYEIRRDDIIELDRNGFFANMLRKAALQFEEIDEDMFRKTVLDELSQQSISKRLYLEDLRNGTYVSPCDVGVGVSQVIPVIVGAIAKKPDGEWPTIVSVEQPELHIHPAAQCALGDLFIREMTGNSIFLIETHSEHLILRLLRRISETSDGEIRNKSLALKPDDLEVMYINYNENEVIITELPVDEDGEFMVGWPEGFFEERATELFGEPNA